MDCLLLVRLTWSLYFAEAHLWLPWMDRCVLWQRSSVYPFFPRDSQGNGDHPVQRLGVLPGCLGPVTRSLAFGSLGIPTWMLSKSPGRIAWRGSYSPPGLDLEEPLGRTARVAGSHVPLPSSR